MAQRKQEFGSGALFRVAGAVYGVMAGDALLALSNILVVLSPLLVSLAGASGGWMVLLAAVPLGPSLAAAAYSSNRLIAGHDSGVARDYLRGLRMNAREALLVWLPFLALLAVISFNLANLRPGSPSEPVLRIALLVLGLLVCATAVNALLLVSRFSFRARDIFRLALYCLGAQKRVSLGNAGILFVTGFLLTTTSVALLLFIAGAVVYLICLNSRPLLTFIEQKFVEQKFTVPAA